MPGLISLCEMELTSVLDSVLTAPSPSWPMALQCGAAQQRALVSPAASAVQ
jgi:hypothetical protein